MRAPRAATRHPRHHLRWRWRWRAMTAGSGSNTRARRRRRDREPDPTARLTDDLLVEILARAPYRSLCRFRCVCKRWRALISDPDRRARLPQTLAGVFHDKPFDAAADGIGSPESESTPHRYCFTSVAGASCPLSFSFLPDREPEHLVLVDSCNGLLLCSCYRFAEEDEFEYLVINPATEEWVAVPITRRWSNKLQTVRLGFEPAISSHFYVFEFQLDMDDDDYDVGDGHVLGVKIYSSATGVWIHKQSGWSGEFSLQRDYKSVFLNGMLYVITMDEAIGAVDVEGKTWQIIDFPRSKDSPYHDTGPGFIDLCQGRLYFVNDDGMVADKLAIWVLEDKDTEEWTLKLTVRYKHLVGKKHVDFGFHDLIVVAIHPDRNMVFFVFGFKKTLMSYDMDSGEVCIIRKLGHTNSDHFLPYVPLFSRSLLDGGNK